MAAETFDALLKIVFIGDTSVGKTCLILRYTHDTFRENFLSTIGVDFKTRKVELNNKTYKLQIWDTAGQERYNTIRKNFYRGAKGVVIVYDVTNIESLTSVTRWMDDVQTNIDSDSDNQPAVLILGNKVDLETERKIPKSTGAEAAKTFGARFAEVSARTGDGVEEAFGGLVQKMCEESERQAKLHRQSYVPSIKLSHTITAQEQTDSAGACNC